MVTLMEWMVINNHLTWRSSRLADTRSESFLFRTASRSPLRYAAMILRCLVSALLLSSGFVFAGPREDGPRLPYNDWGACPFECCTYREWVAAASITVFKNRDEKGEIAFQLKRNERVQAMTGVVVTLKAGVTEVLKPIQVGYLPSGKEPVLALKPGDVVYALHYAGEGNDVFWYKGKTYVDEISVPDNAWGDVPNADTVKVRTRPAYVWWAKVRNRAGQIGWTRKTDQFGNQDACG